MDSGEFITPPDSFSTDQVLNMAEANNTQHANVNNMSSMHQQQQQPFVSGSDHSGDGSDGVTAGEVNCEPEKKQRGRPRMRTFLHGKEVAVGDGNSEAVDDGSGVIDLDLYRRERGRPASILKKQMDALGAPGLGFTPHVIMVEGGEDITSKIMKFCEEGARTVCILSATGIISSVTFQQSPVLGGSSKYEGLFDIITLAGSFVHSESDDSINVSGLSVAIAGGDGRVLGGAVAGPFVAASTVQVVVGSFVKDTAKPKASSESSESDGSSPDMPSPRYPNFGWPSSVSNMPPY